MKPYIGITCGTYRDRDWCPPAILLRKTYTDAIAMAGGVPFIIPVVEDEEVLRALYDRLDGLLISGGGDIEPSRYGEQPLPGLGATDPVRDEVELPLARWAVADGKPVMSNCWLHPVSPSDCIVNGSIPCRGYRFRTADTRRAARSTRRWSCSCSAPGGRTSGSRRRRRSTRQ